MPRREYGNDNAFELTLEFKGRDAYFKRADTGARVDVMPVQRNGFFRAQILGDVHSRVFEDGVRAAGRRHCPTGADGYFPMVTMQDLRNSQRGLFVAFQYYTSKKKGV